MLKVLFWGLQKRQELIKLYVPYKTFTFHTLHLRAYAGINNEPVKCLFSHHQHQNSPKTAMSN